VLMDFGAGQLMADVVGGGGAGTPLYLAPEMFNDAPASVQTDIYALGVLLYYLVTAGYPVPARSIEELKQAHAVGRQRPLLVARPGLPRGFVNVVEKMLKVDPVERYQTANEALAGLKRFTAPASILRTLLKWSWWLAIAAAVTTFYGLTNSVAFNVLLNRPAAFQGEGSLLEWFRWGLASLVAPAVYTAGWALLLTLLAGAWRLLRKLIPLVERSSAALQTMLMERISERGLDDPGIMLQCTAGMGAIALVILAWAFWDYGVGMMTSLVSINEAPVDRLLALQPANEHRVDAYGRLIDLLVLVYGISAFKILARARRINAPISRSMRTTAVIVPVFALVLWQLPYRLMYQSAFERVDLSETRCYNLGESRGDFLLHCPDVPAPRNRVVRSLDPRLRHRGVVENLLIPQSASQPSR